MHVLFCSSGINSLGETLSLASFAKELISCGHQCSFIAPVLAKNYLLTFGFNSNSILTLQSRDKIVENSSENQNYNLFKEFMKVVSPDIVLSSDWHGFSKDDIFTNKSFSIEWISDKILMGTFDHYAYAPFGKQSTLTTCTNVIKRIYEPVPERYSFIIRPCPHNKNLNQFENNIYYWGIFKGKLIRNIGLGKSIRKKNTIKKTKVVFQPVGFWQELEINKIFRENNIDCCYYSDIFLPLMLDYLSNIDHEIQYYFISGKYKEVKKSRHGNVTLIEKPPLPNQEYNDLLSVSDIFICDNIINASLGKAVFGNIIPIVFKNSVTINNTLNLNASFKIEDDVVDKISILIKKKLIYPYKIFPNGFNDISEMYLSNNFHQCFLEQEIFDKKGTIELLYKSLDDLSFKKNIITDQNNYIGYNTALMSAEQILQTFLN